MAAAFGFGAALILGASMLPFGRKLASELWSLYRSEFIIVGCVLVPAAGGKWTFLALLLALQWRGQFELFDLFDRPRIGAIQAVGMLAGLVLVAIGVTAPASLAPAFAISVFAVLAVGFVLERSFTAPRVWLAAASLLFPTLLIALTGLTRARANGFAWLFLIYVTVEMNDAFALVVGKLIGRYRLLPRLSPNKTLEGFIGGFVLGGATGFVIAKYFLGASSAASVLMVVSILVSGLIGDLLSSALKRWRNKKDFKPVVILHGGVLDIYDSLLFAAPALLLLRAGAGF